VIEIPAELIIEGVSRSFDRYLDAHPDMGERLLDKMAELRCELLTPAEAADMLGLTRETLRENYARYGLDKSTALGPNEPRYFRSQIVEAMKREGKVIKGRIPREEKVRASLAGTITPFPRRSAPTIARKEATTA
jgi:hypothetical protein